MSMYVPEVCKCVSKVWGCVCVCEVSLCEVCVCVAGGVYVDVCLR